MTLKCIEETYSPDLKTLFKVGDVVTDEAVAARLAGNSKFEEVA